MFHLQKKRGKTSKPLRNDKVYLLVYNSIKDNGALPKTALSKQALNKYVYRLRKGGYIKKIGYGVWKTSKPYNLYLGVTQGGSDDKVYLPYAKGGAKSDFIRAHNIVFKIKVGKPPLSWEARLSSRNINYSILSNGVARVLFNGFKLWFIKDKVIVYFPPTLDFKAPSVAGSLRLSINRFFSLVNEIEAFIGFSLRSNGALVWALDRKHLSLVKNALAEDYNNKKEKLVVKDLAGPWLIADFSKELNELEAIRSPTNTREAQVIQAFFNDLKLNPTTLSEITYTMSTIAVGVSAQTLLTKEIVEALRILTERVNGL